MGWRRRRAMCKWMFLFFAFQAEEKYKHELMLHASDMQKMNKIKAEVGCGAYLVGSATDRSIYIRSLREMKLNFQFYHVTIRWASLISKFVPLEKLKIMLRISWKSWRKLGKCRRLFWRKIVRIPCGRAPKFSLKTTCCMIRFNWYGFLISGLCLLSSALNFLFV